MAADTKWYYVEKHERKGPVSFENLQQLVAKGTITIETLVWKEGMQDWEKASVIKGLIRPPKEAKEASSVKVTPSRSKPASQNVSAPMNPSAIDSSGKSSPESSQGTTPTAVTVNTGSQLGSSQPSNQELEFSTTNSNSTANQSDTMMNNLLAKSKSIGYPFLIIGFLLVISGKGCDSLGSRWVKGTMVAADLAKNQFEATYAAKENAFQAQITDLNNSDSPNLDRIKTLNGKISDLNKERNEKRRELQASTWSTLDSSASMAMDRYYSWGFTRELIFVFGSMVLSVGLLVVGINGEGSEKWVCLIMLAIITFSVYVGGFAWSASLQNVIPTIR